MEEHTGMNKLPCKDCITFAICKAIYKEVYKSTFPLKDAEGNHNEVVVARILTRNALLRRCSLLKAHLYFMVDEKFGNLDMEKLDELHNFYGENK